MITIKFMALFGKKFRLALLLIIFFELLSFLGYFFPWFNKGFFFLILLITLILSLSKLEYGLYVVLAELFIGSKGYLFYFESGGVMVSIRIGLFLVIMSVWLFNLIKDRLEPNASSEAQQISWYQPFLNLPISYWLLFAVIAWGIIFGLLRGNSFNNVFFDSNHWFYFLYIFPLREVLRTSERIKTVLEIFLASLVDLILKSLFSLWIFAHQINIWWDLYRWLRDSGVGEVTRVAANFYRVFFQSQIYALLGFFILLSLAVGYYWFRDKSELDPLESRNQFRKISVLLVSSLLIIMISFSRSFWIALIGGFFIFLLILKLVQRKRWLGLLKLAGILVSILVIDFVFLYLLVSFPAPTGLSLADLIEERLVTSGEEAAGSSRLNLLAPLGRAIAQHPLIGSGFGTTVTYRTADPRILASSPHGEYTTYAFEWGYLDLWLKIGLVGLIVYLGFIWIILKKGWKIISDARFKFWNFGHYLSFGFFLGLTALLLTNIFTPYLNNPLGIGYLMLTGLIFDQAKVLTT